MDVRVVCDRLTRHVKGSTEGVNDNVSSKDRRKPAIASELYINFPTRDGIGNERQRGELHRARRPSLTLKTTRSVL